MSSIPHSSPSVKRRRNTKRETAKKYTRQVRQYINEQQMKREREKYKQKKLTQQRKKDTLE